jgi:hypothetical protein
LTVCASCVKNRVTSRLGAARFSIVHLTFLLVRLRISGMNLIGVVGTKKNQRQAAVGACDSVENSLTSSALRLAVGADAVADSPRKGSSGLLSDEIGYTTCRNAVFPDAWCGWIELPCTPTRPTDSFSSTNDAGIMCGSRLTRKSGKRTCLQMTNDKHVPWRA